MYDIGSILGIIVATRLLSGMFHWMTKSWDGGLKRLAVIHLVSLITAGFLGGIGLSPDGDFDAIKAIGIYLIPQFLWLIFDFYCMSKQIYKLQKLVMVISGVTALLAMGSLFLLTYFSSSSLETTFQEVSKELGDNENMQLSNANTNKETAAILLESINIPYVMDDKTTLTKITANGDAVTIFIEKLDDQIADYDEERAFWEGYFCNHTQFSQLISDGSNINFLYMLPNGTKLNSYSINCK